MIKKTLFSSATVASLNLPLEESMVKTRVIGKDRSGKNLMAKYLTSTYVVDQANRIFGFGQWSKRIISNTLILRDDTVKVGKEKRAGVEVTYLCHVEVIVNGFVHQDVSTHSSKMGVESESKCHDTAYKGAESTAMVRAFRHFGEQFGNGLYQGNIGKYSTQQNIIKKSFNGDFSLTEEAINGLGDVLEGNMVRTTQGHPYIPSTFIYNQLIRIFNFNYSIRVNEIEMISNVKRGNNIEVTFKSIVSIELANGTVLEGSATCSASSTHWNIGKAIGTSAKGAVSLALTRATRHFGNQFGNVLYQVGKGKNLYSSQQPNSNAKPINLHEEFEVEIQSEPIMITEIKKEVITPNASELFTQFTTQHKVDKVSLMGYINEQIQTTKNLKFLDADTINSIFNNYLNQRKKNAK